MAPGFKKELTKDLNPQDVTQFQKQSPAVQIYLLEEYLASFPDLQLSRAQFEQLHRIVVTKSNTQQVLKNGYELYKDYHYFEIRKISRRTDDQNVRRFVTIWNHKDSRCLSLFIWSGTKRFIYGGNPTSNNHPVFIRPRKREIVF